jgi:CRISPR type I-E-associated protein CasA/Cse1
MNGMNVWVTGETLWATLMLNLMEYDGRNATPFAFRDPTADLPSWERSMEVPGERLPAGPIDMLTFVYRRVRLFWQGERIIGIALTKGDSLPKAEDPVTFEWMLPTVRNKRSKIGEAVFYPLRASLDRQVWREAPALVQSAQQAQLDADSHRAPLLLEWLLKLNDAGLVPDRLRLRVLAVVADQAKPMGWFSQTLNIPLLYMQERKLWNRLHEAIAQAERHEECLRTFKGSPYQVLGEALKLDAKALATFDGRTRYWAALERPFLELMDALPDDRSEDDFGVIRWGETEMPAWERTLMRTVRTAFVDSIVGVADHRARALGLRRLDERLTTISRKD